MTPYPYAGDGVFQRTLKNSIRSNQALEHRISNLVSDFPSALLDTQSASVLYVFDFRTAKYHYVSQSCFSLLGISRKEFYDKGEAVMALLLHPQDKAAFTTEMAAVFMKKARSISDEQLAKSVFGLTFRLKHSNGDYVKCLSQFTIALRDELGHPVIAVGSYTDISLYKSDDLLRLHLTTCSAQGKVVEVLYEKESGSPITKREAEIIKLIADGKANKAISEKLNISIFTVKAHRRNILRKMECDNFSQVVTNARNNAWI